MMTPRILALTSLMLCTSCGLDREGLEGTRPGQAGPSDGSGGGTSDAAGAESDATSDGRVEAGQDEAAGANDAREDHTSSDATSDGTADAPAGDGASDAPFDGSSDASDGPSCSGAVVGGYCWYASAANQSCDTTCAPYGGCNLSGTRDYAGSGGSDANCVAVIAALGFGSYPHQNWSNNDLGCHFAWASWTYWSTALPTTCQAADPGAANAQRMCACNH